MNQYKSIVAAFLETLAWKYIAASCSPMVWKVHWQARNKHDWKPNTQWTCTCNRNHRGNMDIFMTPFYFWSSWSMEETPAAAGGWWLVPVGKVTGVFAGCLCWSDSASICQPELERDRRSVLTGTCSYMAHGLSEAWAHLSGTSVHKTLNKHSSVLLSPDIRGLVQLPDKI